MTGTRTAKIFPCIKKLLSNALILASEKKISLSLYKIETDGRDRTLRPILMGLLQLAGPEANIFPKKVH